jgi:hypothetical protein
MVMSGISRSFSLNTKMNDNELLFYENMRLDKIEWYLQYTNESKL